MNLRTAQTKYRNMIQTREELKSRKSKLDWEIRFGPKHGVTEEKIMAMEEERKSVVKSRKELEETKDSTQRRCEQMRWTITGIGTTSSKDDPEEWGTRTPTPSAKEEEEEEDPEEERSD